ncbi:hypothetical protein ULMS_09110 [Patiriisocius marinistellae]|uniref:HMA domain-containing protein n=1 Tax=Patiriisocius marinistellae TaxID=2494560 RepID=A0A5J4FUD8_9FLAO|nr:heavy metal-associated domain-containing protein [Patiriisocius marinistellae]GEQ85403.1 hypothetical protein ULMS_09110 [Patiriisocius marinistellae]
MKHTYNITGMTCNGCKASVEKTLRAVDDVTDVEVNLESGRAEISMNQHIVTTTFRQALPSKYTISEVSVKQVGNAEIGDKQNIFNTSNNETQTKLEQLKPLFLIFGCIVLITAALNYNGFNISAVMLDFMGIFFFIFSLFKFFNLRGFAQSFSMYDPLAKAVPEYGKVYPFIELILGFMFLSRIQIPIVLIVTIIIIGITTIGVTRSLMSKKTIQCACLGTVLKLPMTEATFIENTIMIVMAIIMITKIYL